MKYGSIVFDMDGVILDSMKEHSWVYAAAEQVARNKGVDEKLEETDKGALLGDQGVKRCVKKCEELGLEPRDTWTEIAQATTRARIERIKSGEMTLVDGAEEVLRKIHVRERGLGLVSNAPDEAVKFVVEHFELDAFFDFYMGIKDFEDLASRKPAPDHLEVARAELGKNPYLYIGDAESDVIAAHRANMDAAWLHPSTESDVKADYELKTLMALKEVMGGEWATTQ